MGHDVHFLSRLSRVPPAQADFALSLYRDPELVRSLLGRVNLPDGTERVAIALEDGPASPHVLVASNGHFVTCLAAGMKFDQLPIISRARVEAAAASQASLRAALAKARQFKDDEAGWLDLLARPLRDGARLSREAYVELESLTPLLGHVYAERNVRSDKLYRQLRGHLLARPRLLRRPEVREAYWQSAWAATHFDWLIFPPEVAREEGAYQDDYFGSVTARLIAQEEFAPMYLRAMASACAVDEAALPGLTRLLANPGLPSAGALAILAGTALRCPELRERVERIVADNSFAPSDMFTAMLTPTDGELPGAQLARKDLVARAADAGVELPHDDPEEMTRLSVATITTRVFHPREANHLGILTFILPWLATRPASDWYLPERYLDLAPTSAEGIVGGYIDVARSLLPQPVRAAARPGRNDPCSCGSGRKFKKCCG